MVPRNAVTNALVTRMSQTPVTAPRPNPTRPVLSITHLLLLPTDIRDASERKEDSMTDKTDPRLDYERRTIPIDDDALANEVAASHLARLDAADRAAGIVRVDTTDEALAWAVAQYWCVHEGVGKTCQKCRYATDDFLAALREAAQ